MVSDSGSYLRPKRSGRCATNPFGRLDLAKWRCGQLAASWILPARLVYTLPGHPEVSQSQRGQESQVGSTMVFSEFISSISPQAVARFCSLESCKRLNIACLVASWALGRGVLY